MKVTVCFDAVKVIVPCGDGELTVGDLIDRAVARYRKASNKHPDDFIQVQVLETIEDQGILDPDDLVRDVLDDRDKLTAVYEEHTINRPTHNGGDGMSTPSVGTASPDVFQSESANLNLEPNNRTPPNSVKDENHNNSTLPRIITNDSMIQMKGPPPPVPPKPGRRLEPSISTSESVPSEGDSGISIDVRARMESDSLNSEYSEPVSTPRVMKTSETAFVAIGTPVQLNKHFEFNGDKNPRKESSSDFEHTDDDDVDGFSLSRNMSRQSMFVDNPVMDRWAELQDENQRSSIRKMGPPVVTVSPIEERSFSLPAYKVQHYVDDMDDVDSSHSLSSDDDSDDILEIELRPDDEEDLGFTVQGYKTADGRELGLIVREIAPGKCASRDGRLQVADRIVEVNHHSLVDLPNNRAEEIFYSAIKSPVVQLVVSGAHSFVPGNTSKPVKPVEPVIIKAEFQSVKTDVPLPSVKTDVPLSPTSPRSPEPNGIEPPPGFRDNGKMPFSASQISLNNKMINRRILLELNKGADGLGFSITTRDNPAGGHTPIFVKSILAKGAAIHDGRLQSGDQIIEVNGVKMMGKNQGEAVNVLRSQQGLVKLLIQREEVIQASSKPAIELNEESTRYLREQGKQVITFKIPLNMSGAAGLGVSVKGKVADPVDGRDSSRDKGIFVKSVIAGGAASKDGRLKADDQLLSVNNVSFMGLTNTEAISNLRIAMQNTRLGQAFIETTVARDKVPLDALGTLYDSKSLEALNAPQQERSIEAGEQSPLNKEPPQVYINGPHVNKEPPQVYINGPHVNREPLPVYVNGPVTETRPVNNAQYEEDDETDGFDVTPISPLNLTPEKPRNAVQRNESYCCAVDRRSPGYYSQKTPPRPSPLTLREQPSMASTPTGAHPATRIMPPGPSRPTSTVAVPTPPLESTGGPSRGLMPVPPPRNDSFRHGVAANYRIYQHFAETGSPNLNNRQAQAGAKPPQPPPPPPVPQPSTQAPDGLPSYDQAIERLRSSSSSSSEHALKRCSWTLEDNKDVVFEGSDLPNDNPFDREGFGRMSMSEKRGRAALDAKKTEAFQRRDKERATLERMTSGPRDEEEDTGRPGPLRKAKSMGQMLPPRAPSEQASSLTRQAPATRPMWKSNSESVLRDPRHGDVPVSDRRKNSRTNPNFRNAVETAPPNGQVRDMPNGNPRISQSDEPQDEIPITMTSKADFNEVQQKLANKKPFYRKFKLGKTRRGDYNLSDNEVSPKHQPYSQEALIDFPAEQRYRQLVSHYGQEDWDERSSRQSTDNSSNHSSSSATVKIGRVIVSEPTRV